MNIPLLRSCLFAALFYGLTLVMVFLYLPALILPRPWARGICASWVTLMMGLVRHVLGIRYEIRRDAGVDAIPGPVIFAAKHQSMWETLAFGIIFNLPAYVLKRELVLIPFFGLYLLKSGMIPVDRQAGARSLRKMLAAARKAATAGHHIVIYPQGTRVAPGDRRPYLPGVAALYGHLELPVVPVALNSGRLWPRHRFVKYPGVVTVRLLAPIPPGLPRKEFMRQLETRIEEAVHSLDGADSS